MGPTPQKTPRQIRLTYDTQKDQVTSDPPAPLRFTVGEDVVFVSDQNIHVELHPLDHYQPNTYATGGTPVHVLKKLTKPGKIWCFVTPPAGAQTWGPPKKYGIDSHP